MPRKKSTQEVPPDEVLLPDEPKDMDEELDNEDLDTRSGGLDIYDEFGDLIEEGEPTYIEEDSEDEFED